MNPLKTQLNHLLTKPMSRQDFFKHVAIGLVAMTGFSAALKLLNLQPNQQAKTLGYGDMPYGGVKEYKKLG